MKKLLILMLFALPLFSLSDEIKPSETKTVDYACVNDCTAQGYSWGYCQNACSY